MSVVEPEGAVAILLLVVFFKELGARLRFLRSDQVFISLGAAPDAVGRLARQAQVLHGQLLLLELEREDQRDVVQVLEGLCELDAVLLVREGQALAGAAEILVRNSATLERANLPVVKIPLAEDLEVLGGRRGILGADVKAMPGQSAGRCGMAASRRRTANRRSRPWSATSK